ncbi:MAG: DUF3857 domain-containing protein [Bacteroidetes bacterium]|nr:DUF3857 domain-containing protein [Bacteroidota bacterium]
MTKNKTLCLLLILLGFSLTAQDWEPYFDYESYDWQEDQAVYDKVVDDSTSAVVVFEKLLYNYSYTDENILVMDRLYHRRVYINSTRALEEFNRKYIPTGEGSELLKFRARAINAGKEIEIDEDDIQTGTLEDSEEEYDYFAFEGLELGSEVEYYYVNRFRPNTNGLMITYQEDIAIENFEIEVITPWNLIFAAKVYNLPDSVQNDTSIENENRLYLHTSVPAFEAESVSPEDALKGRIIFKLDQNLYTGDRDITSYNYTAQNVASFLSSELDRKAKKVIKKEAENAQEYLLEEYPDFSVASRVEHYIKDNYNYYDAAAPQLSDIEFMEESKVFNTVGAVRLYGKIFDYLEIPYQFVYTTNRNNLYFDEDFASNNYLSQELIYLADEELYIDPTEVMSRNGVMNFNFTGNKGLFIERELLGDEYVATTSINEIPYRPASFTSDTIKAKVVFGPDMLDNKVEVYRALTGYSARSYQGIFELIEDEDDLKEIKESLVSYIDEEAKVDDLEVTNAKAIYLGVKPLQARASLSDFRFMESAGQDLLLNVGKLIGPQMTMYDEDSVRDFDIYNPFSRAYYRSIEFAIPAGYKLANPEKLRFDEKLLIEGEIKAIFKSDYRIEGNTVVVIIEEWYEDQIYPKEYFQEYLKVINAAADFNKVSVLLEKEV